MEFLNSLGVFGSILRILIILLEVLVVFNFMIIIHEWGHFLAARWRGLQVDKFYIWFGKPLWKKTIHGVEYGLGCIPMGGFVALPQMAPQGGIEGDEADQRASLPPITPLDKIIVAFAGPLFSFLLAVAFAILVSFLGTPKGKDFTSTIIGYVDEKSAAAQDGGLKVGDEILRVDGKEVKRFNGPVDSVVWAVVSSEGEKIQFDVKRAGQELPPIYVSPTKEEQEPGILSFLFKRPPLRRVGIAGATLPLVGEVMANSPAADAGVQENDVLLAVNGEPLLSTMRLSEIIKAAPTTPVKLTVERGQEMLLLTMQPRAPDQWENKPTEKSPEELRKKFQEREHTPLIGIQWDLHGKRFVTRPTVMEQVEDGFKSMYQTISKVISPKSEIGVSHMSGFLGIVRVYYNLFEQEDAWRWVLAFSVLLNINLAVMNMIPFPVLDGGHIVMATIEWITRRVPRGRVLEAIQTACVLMLLSFMLWVTLKDAGDWVSSSGGSEKSPKAIFLPKESRTATP